MGFIDLIFGAKKSEFRDYFKNGAIILDVRTLKEWNNGHIKNSKLIPLNELDMHIAELKLLNQPILVCCQSGIRSGNAAKKLKTNGIDAINGGGWKN